MTERFFDDNASVACASGTAEILDHGREQARRNRQVVRGTFGPAHRLEQRGVRRRILVVAVDIAETCDQPGESFVVDAAAVLLDTLARAGAKLIEIPAR